jgi:hypothetical protein
MQGGQGNILSRNNKVIQSIAALLFERFGTIYLTGKPSVLLCMCDNGVSHELSYHSLYRPFH